MERDNKILAISNILNDCKVWQKIEDSLSIDMDSNSMIFHDIEEFIMDKLEEMQEDNNQ